MWATGILELVGLRGGLHLGVDGDLLPGQQSALQDLRLPGRDEETELGLRRPPPRPRIPLQGIWRGSKLGRPLAMLTTPRAPRSTQAAWWTPPMEPSVTTIFPATFARSNSSGRSHPDPDQGGRHIGVLAPVGQHGRHVLVGGQLLPDGRHLPQLPLDPVPDLATRGTEPDRRPEGRIPGACRRCTGPRRRSRSRIRRPSRFLL